MSDLLASPRKGALWAAALLAFFAASIAGYGVLSYLTGHPLTAGFLLGKAHYQKFVPTTAWTVALVVHVAGGSLALLAGGLQWLGVRLKTLRARPAAFRRLHVTTGLLYVLGIAAGASAGLILAFQAMGGPVSSWGFGLLDALWVAVTARAAFLGMRLRRPTPGVDAANLRRLHHSWMVRSYALTAAAITLRLWLPLLTVAAGFDFVAAYMVISWLCWVPNLVAAEVLVRLR